MRTPEEVLAQLGITPGDTGPYSYADLLATAAHTLKLETNYRENLMRIVRTGASPAISSSPTLIPMENTPVESIPLVYHGADTAPDKDGLVLSVTVDGVKIGTLNCFALQRTPRLVLRWYARKHPEKPLVSGGAHETREQAAGDVQAWHEGRTPAYVQHAVVPCKVTARPCTQPCGTCEKGAEAA